jgi:putative DNA methylase
MAYPKRLIEVDLPIKRISAHARCEKTIRHVHISTLRIWWARRQLAACRAVICSALWPDPAAPATFDWQPFVKVEHYRLRQDSDEAPG